MASTDSIFKRAYKESNNFNEFWGTVVFLFHTELGLYPNVTIQYAMDWYKDYYDGVRDSLNQSVKHAEELLASYDGVIPEWDGVSGVEELKVAIRDVLNNHIQKQFNKDKEEALNGV